MSKKYRSGLVLGKFLPFHLGHKYLIDIALENCDIVHVIVCHNRSQMISGESRIDSIRFTYSKNINVIVHSLEDDELPQSDKESPSLDHFYGMWVPVVRDLVSELDCVFTSEDYGDDFARYLGIDHFLVDRNRVKYSISGTEIRNDPIKNWDFISEELRSNFVKKVAIVGPESTGKTTLTQNLSSYFNTNFVLEYGRLVSENKPDLDIDDFYHISEGRRSLENWMIIYSNKLLICDTEDITTYTYSKMYCPNDYLKYDDYFEKVIRLYDYDFYILLRPDCESVQDGTRRYINDREIHYNNLKNNLDKFCKIYFEIGGDWENRYTESKKIINELIYNKWN